MKLLRILLTAGLFCLGVGKPLMADQGMNPATSEISYTSPIDSDFSMWFGGDNRAQFKPRNIGVGQKLVFPEALKMSQFGFSLGAFNPVLDSIPLVLQVRDENGQILNSYEKNLPGDFSGGFVVFDIDELFPENVALIMTMYLKDGETLESWTSVKGYTS